MPMVSLISKDQLLQFILLYRILLNMILMNHPLSKKFNSLVFRENIPKQLPDNIVNTKIPSD